MVKEKDLVHGPLARSMASYALPVALTGILQQLFNAADVKETEWAYCFFSHKLWPAVTFSA